MIDCLRMKGFYHFKKIILKEKLKNIPLYIILFTITKNTGNEIGWNYCFFHAGNFGMI